MFINFLFFWVREKGESIYSGLGTQKEAHIQIAVAEKVLAAANLWVGRVTVWRRVEENADGRATRMQRAMEAMTEM